MPHAVDQVPELVRELYSVVKKFESLFPERKFTPDGHLVGSIGEVIATHRYSLELLPASSEGHDAKASDGRFVEIKATQGKSVALRSQPEHLLVLYINSLGNSSQVFNGPGSLAWEHCGNIQKTGQRSISLTKLRKLMSEVPEKQQLPIRIDE
jgi:hypothetical protein